MRSASRDHILVYNYLLKITLFSNEFVTCLSTGGFTARAKIASGG
jgi:hypothetical protein